MVQIRQCRATDFDDILVLLRQLWPGKPLHPTRLRSIFDRGLISKSKVYLGGPRHLVYGIGNKGAALLKHELGLALHPSRWSEKNRSVGRIYFDHALLVSDVMVAIELACRETDHIRLLGTDELSLPGQTPSQA